LTILLNQQIPYTGLVTTVAVGGTASTLAGGTFEQGAMTAGLGYLFNSCASNPSSCLNPEAKGPGMVDVTLPDGTSMYVPQGAAADVATYIASHSEAQAEVNQYWGDAAIMAGTSFGGGLVAPVLGKTLGPSGQIFGRARLGGSSLFGINSNDALRIGWGWKGSATSGTEVFRVSGDWVRALGVKSGHIDLLTRKP
ncbi:hypothetical protein, partial [Magnetospirillum aberrantis]